jgi:hypothetical protein
LFLLKGEIIFPQALQRIQGRFRINSFCGNLDHRTLVGSETENVDEVPFGAYALGDLRRGQLS